MQHQASQTRRNIAPVLVSSSSSALPAQEPRAEQIADQPVKTPAAEVVVESRSREGFSQSRRKQDTESALEACLLETEFGTPDPSARNVALKLKEPSIAEREFHSATHRPCMSWYGKGVV